MGIVVFVILVIIQFVVITKGAAASPKWRRGSPWTPCPASRWRSTPTSTPASSTRTRPATAATKIAAEADFYGAMDGASKFVRGDAIAAIIIVIVNILGGFAVGMLKSGGKLDMVGVLQTYTLLTVGEGLVTQIPR